MAGDTIRIRLKAGEAEIEVEGTKADVDALLDRWWTAALATPPDPPEPEKKKKQKQAPRQRVSPPADDPDAPNIQDIVNSLKESQDFELLENKVFHKPDRYRKVAAVLWFAERDLATGEIHAVLTGIGVKIDQPGVSNAIGSNQGKFVNDQPRKGGRKTRYSLTSKARKEFDDWLKSNE